MCLRTRVPHQGLSALPGAADRLTAQALTEALTAALLSPNQHC